MSMFKKKKVSLPHVILYILFLFAYYTITKNLSASVLGSIIAPLYYKIPLPILFTIGLLLIIIIDLLIPSLAVGILFFFFVPEQYHKNNQIRKQRSALSYALHQRSPQQHLQDLRFPSHPCKPARKNQTGVLPQ